LNKVEFTNKDELSIHKLKNLQDVKISRGGVVLSDTFQDYIYYNTNKMKDCTIILKFTTGKVKITTKIEYQLIAVLMRMKKVFIKKPLFYKGDEDWFKDSDEAEIDEVSVDDNYPTEISMLNTEIILPPHEDVFVFTNDRLVINGYHYTYKSSKEPILNYCTSAELLGPNMLKVVYHDTSRVIQLQNKYMLAILWIDLMDKIHFTFTFDFFVHLTSETTFFRFYYDRYNKTPYEGNWLDIHILKGNNQLNENIQNDDFKKLVVSDQVVECTFEVLLKKEGLVIITNRVPIPLVLWMMKLKNHYIKTIKVKKIDYWQTQIDYVENKILKKD
jgi:hypothetical protein